ncbi:MAG: YcaO-like family protein [Pseudomonadota bacterium]
MTEGAAPLRDGARRAVSPEVTWERLAPLLPVFGISRVANITGLDRIGIPVFTACRPNGRSLSVFQGKGVSVMAARVSAVMEAYETWCAERIDAPLRLASAEEMAFAHPIAELGSLPLADPEGFDPSAPFLWIEGEDLAGGGTAYVPFELVHTHYALPEPQHSGAFNATTNGLASGNTLMEATLHALMEVIERDAVTLWKLSPAAWSGASAVRLDTVTDPACAHLLSLFAGAGIDVAVFDATSDIGLPTFLALIDDAAGVSGAPEIGQGTHPSPAVALSRALTEAAQARATFIAGAREDIGAHDYGEAEVSARRRAARNVFDGLTPSRDFAAIRSVETASIEADVAHAIDALKGVGLDQVICVDVSRKGLPFSVVRVVVPGLEAAWEGPQSGLVPGPRALAVLSAVEAAA